ncbi:protein artichoke-like [Venturia canescens]|uniref:protein artichoke-like n=1 Tax=Venturia canescens TaxID=32260 RepID=UPI001C9CC3F5|nr:protein artichoke-like [Venturia canescens]
MNITRSKMKKTLACPAILGLLIAAFLPFSSGGICELCVCTHSENSKIINCLKNRELTNYTEIFDLLAFDESELIKKLIIMEHEISSLPLDAFRGLRNLKSLDLSKNLIEDFEADVFKDLKNLEELDFSQNHLGILGGDIFKNIPFLVTLNLSHNSIDDLNETTAGQLGKLESLDLSHNQIKSIGSEFMKSLSGLKFLNISYNRIDSITSDVILHLKSLKELQISNNLLTIIPVENFPESLTTLNVAGNSIKSLPLDFSLISNLNVANNQINSIESDERWLKKLRYLNFSGNFLTSFPNVIFDDLNSLDLSRNKFNVIPKYLSSENLPKLEILVIDGNPIKDLIFVEKLQLRRLYVRHFDQLEILEKNAFAKLQGIDGECVDLIISGNPRLHRIEEGALNGVSICTLDLSGNAFVQISPELIKSNGKFVAKKGIDFQENPFNCECQLQWMLNDFVPYVYDLNPKLLENLRCETPTELSGTRMVHWYKWTRQVFCDPSLSRMGKMVVDPAAVISSGETTIRFESSGGMLAVVAGALATLCVLIVVGIILARKFELRKRRTNRRF